MNKTKTPKKLNGIRPFDVILAIIMILFMLCIILPFVHIIAVSFSSNEYVVANMVSLFPKKFTLLTYKSIMEDGAFFRAYGNTIIYTLVGTALSLIVTAMGAYAMSTRRIVGHKIFSLMITITMFFSGGLIPTYLVISSYGLIDSRWAMILPSLVSVWNFIIMRSFFVAYPHEIVESGLIDGLQDAGVFFRLVLPTSKASLATIGLYYAVSYWNSYLPARLYLRNEQLYPVQLLLQRLLTIASQELPDSEERVIVTSVRYASILLTILPIICVYPFIQKYFVKGVMVGSIKG